MYLLGKHKIQVYRYDEDTLCIYFQSGQTVNNIIPQLEKLNIKLDLFVRGDTEFIYFFDEKELSKVHSVVKFQIKGKNIQAKSVRNKRRLQQKKNEDS